MSWFDKLREMSDELAESFTQVNQLLVSVYEMLRRYFGCEPLGTREHKQTIYNRFLSGGAFKHKGVKVSPRRWLGWFDAASKFLPQWHSTLLAILAMGQTFKVTSIIQMSHRG